MCKLTGDPQGSAQTPGALGSIQKDVSLGKKQTQRTKGPVRGTTKKSLPEVIGRIYIHIQEISLSSEAQRVVPWVTELPTVHGVLSSAPALDKLAVVAHA